jgi:hypothetical protein
MNMTQKKNQRVLASELKIGSTQLEKPIFALDLEHEKHVSCRSTVIF